MEENSNIEKMPIILKIVKEIAEDKEYTKEQKKNYIQEFDLSIFDCLNAAVFDYQYVVRTKFAEECYNSKYMSLEEKEDVENEWLIESENFTEILLDAYKIINYHCKRYNIDFLCPTDTLPMKTVEKRKLFKFALELSQEIGNETMTNYKREYEIINQALEAYHKAFPDEDK